MIDLGKFRLTSSLFRQKGEFDDFRQFAQWYMRSENAFIDFGHVLTFGLRYEDEKFGKLTRER